MVSYNVVVLNNVVNHHEELRAGYGTPEMIYGIRVHSVLVKGARWWKQLASFRVNVSSSSTTFARFQRSPSPQTEQEV